MKVAIKLNQLLYLKKIDKTICFDQKEKAKSYKAKV